jgi:hypothetical protein
MMTIAMMIEWIEHPQLKGHVYLRTDSPLKILLWLDINGLEILIVCAAEHQTGIELHSMYTIPKKMASTSAHIAASEAEFASLQIYSGHGLGVLHQEALEQCISVPEGCRPSWTLLTGWKQCE